MFTTDVIVSEISDFFPPLVDNQPPSITCPPSNLVAVNNEVNSSQVQFSRATVSDDCGIATVQYTSGSLQFTEFGNKTMVSIFPLNTTVVTATATDKKGNQAMCQFTITVEGQSLLSIHLNVNVLHL